MIFNYTDFILENMINESMLYYSPKVRSILNSIDDPIAKELVELETTNLPIDVTFVDLDQNKEGYLTFTTMKSAEKWMEPMGQETIDFMNGSSNIFEPSKAREGSDSLWDKRNDVYNKSRNPIKIGKFVNSLLTNKYSEKQREVFVNKFKSKIDVTGEKFIIVEGSEIDFYYWQDNYKKGGGTLNSSCMRDVKDIFELYVKNPNVCRLLVLLEDGLVIGRALIWKLSYIEDDLFEYFMDRQYTIKESDVNKFRVYADDNNWGYKTDNNHSSYSDVTIKGRDYNNILMEVNVKSINYNRFPYMDTFRSYNHYKHILINKNMGSDEDYYILDGVEGHDFNNNSTIWSDYEQEDIDREDAIYSEPLNSWIRSYNSVEIEKGDLNKRGHWPDDDEDVVLDGWNEEYIHKDNAIYSEEYDYYLFDEDAVNVISDIDEEGNITNEVDMHNQDSDIILISEIENSNWYDNFKNGLVSWNDFRYIKKILLSKDYMDVLVPDVFLLDVYKIDKNLNLFKDIDDDFIENFKDIDMLTEEDAMLFDLHGINYDDEQQRNRIKTSERMDKWTYNDYILPIKNILIEELNRRIRLEDDNLIKYKLRLEEIEIGY